MYLTKLVFILPLMLIILSCGDETKDTGSTIFNPSIDCNMNDLYECDSGNYTQINYCIDCELCNSDTRFSIYQNIRISIEKLPDRTGEVIKTIALEDNRIYQGTVCVPYIEGQDSLVIGLWFVRENNSGEGFLATYEKIKVNKMSTTNFHKKITTNDFWNKPPCQMYATLQRLPDFEVDGSAISCIVGSPGDCVQVSSLETLEEFNTNIENNIQYWTEWYQARSTNTPCGEIYIHFD